MRLYGILVRLFHPTSFIIESNINQSNTLNMSESQQLNAVLIGMIRQHLGIYFYHTRNHFQHLHDVTRLIPSFHSAFIGLLLFRFLSKLRLNKRGPRVRIPNFAIRTVRFEHYPVEWDVGKNAEVLFGFETAAVYTDVEVELQYLF